MVIPLKRCGGLLVASMLCVVLSTSALTAQTNQLAQAAPPQAAPPTVATPPANQTAPADQSAANTNQTADPEPAGNVATLKGTATVTRNGTTTPLKLQDDIYKGDDLQTGKNSTLGVTFTDDTTLNLSASSRVVVDNFVFQEGAKDNAALINVTKGTMAFVAAAVAKTGDMKIKTPAATLGIRGTTGVVEVPEGAAASTGSNVKLYPDADGRVGRIEARGRDGAPLGTLTQAASGFTFRGAMVSGFGMRMSAVPMVLSPQMIARDRGFVQRVHSMQGIGRQIVTQQRNFRLQNPGQRGFGRPGFNQPGQQRPGLNQPGLRGQQPGLNRPGQLNRPGSQPGSQPGLRNQPRLPDQPGRQPALNQRTPNGLGQPGRSGLPGSQPGLQRTPGLPNQPGGLQRAPGTPNQYGSPYRPGMQRPVGVPGSAPGGYQRPAGIPGVPSAIQGGASGLINRLGVPNRLGGQLPSAARPGQRLPAAQGRTPQLPKKPPPKDVR